MGEYMNVADAVQRQAKRDDMQSESGIPVTSDCQHSRSLRKSGRPSCASTLFDDSFSYLFSLQPKHTTLQSLRKQLDQSIRPPTAHSS